MFNAVYAWQRVTLLIYSQYVCQQRRPCIMFQYCSCGFSCGAIQLILTITHRNIFNTFKKLYLIHFNGHIYKGIFPSVIMKKSVPVFAKRKHCAICTKGLSHVKRKQQTHAKAKILLFVINKSFNFNSTRSQNNWKIWLGEISVKGSNTDNIKF